MGSGKYFGTIPSRKSSQNALSTKGECAIPFLAVIFLAIFLSEKRALWLLSGCLSVPSDEGEPQPQAVGSACRWESECCTAVGAFLETAMKKRITLAGLPAEETDSSPLLSSREHDSDSDGDSSDDDVPLRSPLIRSKHRLARSMHMASAAADETYVRHFIILSSRA